MSDLPEEIKCCWNCVNFCEEECIQTEDHKDKDPEEFNCSQWEYSDES